MNRTRMMYLINQARKEAENILKDRLGEWHRILVKAKSDHMADRIGDRSDSIKASLNIASEMMFEFCSYHACTILHYAVKAKESSEMQNVIIYRKVGGKTFAIPVTIRYYEDEEEKDLIAVVFRSVIPEYELSLNTRNSVHLNHKAPKITFEYNGYRRQLSRLERLVTSPNCPEPLRGIENAHNHRLQP